MIYSIVITFIDGAHLVAEVVRSYKTKQRALRYVKLMTVRDVKYYVKGQFEIVDVCINENKVYD